MSLQLNDDYWNSRYKNHQTGWDAGDITTPLKDYFDQVQERELNILIPGAGNAYEAEYLFKLGFSNTTVLDYAQLAIDSFSQRLPAFPKERLIKQNFFSHKGQYDLIIEQTFFCALDPKLRVDYVDKCWELLREGGKLVGLLWGQAMNSDHPPFGGTQKEYVSLFERRFHIQIMETAHNSIAPREGTELFIKFLKK